MGGCSYKADGVLTVSACAPGVSHPCVLLRDVPVCCGVAHPGPQHAPAGLPCLEVGLCSPSVSRMSRVYFPTFIQRFIKGGDLNRGPLDM